MSDLSLEDHIANLQSPDPNVRRNAVWVLGRARDLRIVVPLIAALSDEDASVRVRAAESLAGIRDPRIVPPLRIALHKDRDPAVRAQAAASLGHQGDPSALDALIAGLNDPESSVRIACAETLGQFQHDSAVQPLIDVLLADSDPDVRYQASRSLARIAAPVTTRGLIAALTSHQPDLSARLYIAEILGQLRDPHARDALTQLSQDEDEGVRLTAEWALQRINRT